MLMAVSISSLAKSLEGPIPVKRKSVLVCNSFERSIRSSKEQATVPRSNSANMTFIYIYSICKLILGKIANFPKIADTLTKFFHTEHNEGPFRRMRRLRTLHCGRFTDFSQRKKRRIKRKGYRYLSIRKWKAV